MAKPKVQTITLKVSENTKEKMQKYFEDKKRPKTPPYAVFQADEADTVVTLYESGKVSKAKIATTHKRFVAKIEQKLENKMSRTMEINAAKLQAMKELGYTELNEANASEVLAKIIEIESRKVSD